MKTIKIYILGLCFSLLFFVVPAQAFSISPTKVLVTLTAGGSDVVKMNIKNESDQVENYQVSIVNVEQDDVGRPIFNGIQSPAMTWIKPEENISTLTAWENKEIKFLIETPEEAQAGSYYLGLAVKKIANTEDVLLPNELSGQLVSLLYLKVSGLANESLNIFLWQADKKFIQQREWSYILGLKNQGNIEVPLQGTLLIRNWRNKEIYQKELTLGPTLIATEERKMDVKIKTDQGFLWPGLYQAQINIMFGKSQQSVSGIFSFWYFPWWSLIFVGGVLFGAIGIYIFKIKNKKGKSI
jgi:hypothetical protein